MTTSPSTLSMLSKANLPYGTGALSSINSRLVSAQANGKHTDVTFHFNTSTESPVVVKAHKLILALGSPVFDTMFFSSSLWAKDAVIEITDIEHSTFKAFVECLYSGQLPPSLSVDRALKLWYTASKYCVEDLASKVAIFLKESITLETALSILKASILFGNSDLEQISWNSIDLDADRIVLTDEFMHAEESLVSKILDRERLSITEINLFNAIVRWGEFQCTNSNSEKDLKTVLQSLVKKIRFPTMDATDFANGPALSGLLTEEEISNIMITKFSTIDFNKPKLFSPKPREKYTRRLECQCRLKFSCSFCRDRNVKEESLRPQTTGRRSINMFQNPPCYCGCRVQGYCPTKVVL